MRADTGASPRRRAGRTPPKRHSSPKKAQRARSCSPPPSRGTRAPAHSAEASPPHPKSRPSFLFPPRKNHGGPPAAIPLYPEKTRFRKRTCHFFGAAARQKGAGARTDARPFLLFYFAFARKPRKVFIRSAALFIRSAALFIRSAAPQRGRALPPPKRGSAPK